MTTREYVTVAEIGFAPYLLTMYRSLQERVPGFHLTVACADGALQELLEALALEHVSIAPMAQPTLPGLRQARQTRTIGEYCWTLTPFLPELAFGIRTEAEEVTYIDADLWLLADPSPIHEEFHTSQAACFITPHAFAPEWDASKSSGYFCVQYLPVRRDGSADILGRWQEQCLERCSPMAVDGGLGDQGYLNDWPQRYGAAVHVASHPQWFQGPWNAERFPYSEAITFHFHGLRLRDRDRVWLGTNPIPGPTYHNVYEPYLRELRRSVDLLSRHGVDLRVWEHPMSGPGRLVSAGSRLNRWGRRALPGRSQRF